MVNKWVMRGRRGKGTAHFLEGSTEKFMTICVTLREPRVAGTEKQGSALYEHRINKICGREC